jgi:hypothetical protein
LSQAPSTEPLRSLAPLPEPGGFRGGRPLNRFVPGAFLRPSGSRRYVMRLPFLAVALALLPAAAIAQDTAPPSSDVAVETVGLNPGEGKTFVLRPGGHHNCSFPPRSATRARSA